MPTDGSRQVRHVLRYLLFPDRVERMSSNGDRRTILAAFGAASSAQSKKWSDRQFDRAMLLLRQQLEPEHPGVQLDFYIEPLRGRWSRPGADSAPAGVMVRVVTMVS